MNIITFDRAPNGDTIILEMDARAVQPYATHRALGSDLFDGHYFTTFNEALQDYQSRLSATSWIVIDHESADAFGPFLSNHQALKSAVRRYRELDEDFEERWLNPDATWVEADYAQMETELINAGVMVWQMVQPSERDAID